MESIAEVAKSVEDSEVKTSLTGLADLRSSDWPKVEEPVDPEPPRKTVTLEKPPDYVEPKAEVASSAKPASTNKPAQNANSSSGDLTADELR